MQNKNVEVNETINTKKIKAGRWVSLAFATLFLVTAIVKLIIIGVTGDDPYNRMVSLICMIVVSFLPFIVEFIFGRRLSDFILLFFYVYVFFAMYLGNAFYLFGLIPGYDKVLHTLFGYVGCLVGLYCLCRFDAYDKMSPVLIGLVLFFFSLGLAGVWEISEFFGDKVLGQTAQGPPIFDPETGKEFTAVDDTMWDTIAHFCGATVFIIHFSIHRKTKKNLGLGLIVDDFSTPQPRIREKKVKNTQN